MAHERALSPTDLSRGKEPAADIIGRERIRLRIYSPNTLLVVPITTAHLPFFDMLRLDSIIYTPQL